MSIKLNNNQNIINSQYKLKVNNYLFDWQLMLIHQLLQVVVKVAVIGAGVSGMGSSSYLSGENIQHVIIEGRGRHGGRITPSTLDGARIELGAAFVHKAGVSNRIHQIVDKMGMNFTQINTGPSQFSYQGLGVLNQTSIDDGYSIYADACTHALDQQNKSSKALNLKQAIGKYFKDLTGHTAQAVGTGQWFYNLPSNYNGAKLTDLGTEQCQEGTLSQGDYLPHDGFSAIVDYIFSTLTPKTVYLNQTVKKIDYSGPLVKIYTQDTVYTAEKVISSLPLGVLQKDKVEFVPKLPKDQQKAIKELGNGIYNKVFVSFEQAFWDTTAQWVDFITKTKENKYAASRTVPRSGKNMLCFFVSADNSKQISKFTQQQLRQDLLSYLKRFFPDKDIKIRAIKATSWHQDEFSLGSYSFQKVGTKPEEIIPKLCAPLDNKVWFAGEHCHPTLYSYSHGAFETGVWAGEGVKSKL